MEHVLCLYRSTLKELEYTPRLSKAVRLVGADSVPDGILEDHRDGLLSEVNALREMVCALNAVPDILHLLKTMVRPHTPSPPTRKLIARARTRSQAEHKSPRLEEENRELRKANLLLQRQTEERLHSERSLREAIEDRERRAIQDNGSLMLQTREASLACRSLRQDLKQQKAEGNWVRLALAAKLREARDGEAQLRSYIKENRVTDATRRWQRLVTAAVLKDNIEEQLVEAYYQTDLASLMVANAAHAVSGGLSMASDLMQAKKSEAGLVNVIRQLSMDLHDMMALVNKYAKKHGEEPVAIRLITVPESVQTTSPMARFDIFVPEHSPHRGKTFPPAVLIQDNLVQTLMLHISLACKYNEKLQSTDEQEKQGIIADQLCMCIKRAFRAHDISKYMLGMESLFCISGSRADPENHLEITRNTLSCILMHLLLDNTGCIGATSEVYCGISMDYSINGTLFTDWTVGLSGTVQLLTDRGNIEMPVGPVWANISITTFAKVCEIQNTISKCFSNTLTLHVAARTYDPSDPKKVPRIPAGLKMVTFEHKPRKKFAIMNLAPDILADLDSVGPMHLMHGKTEYVSCNEKTMGHVVTVTRKPRATSKPTILMDFLAAMCHARHKPIIKMGFIEKDIDPPSLNLDVAATLCEINQIFSSKVDTERLGTLRQLLTM